jgi:hypothetical protein
MAALIYKETFIFAPRLVYVEAQPCGAAARRPCFARQRDT